MINYTTFNRIITVCLLCIFCYSANAQTTTVINSTTPTGGITTSTDYLYIGPSANITIPTGEIWIIKSRYIQISPGAIITGNGTMRIDVPPTPVSVTTISGGNVAINTNVSHNNANNIILDAVSLTTDAITAGITSNTNHNLYIESGAFTWNAGNYVTIGNNDFIFGATATQASFSSVKFIVTNGTGHVVKENYIGDWIFPIGIATGGNNYSPAKIANNATANTFHVSVQNYATSASNEVTNWCGNGIDRTWNIFADNSTGNAEITLQHQVATNQSARYSNSSHFVSQWSADIPNNSGDLPSPYMAWQNNTAGGGVAGTLIATGGSVSGSSMRSRIFEQFATSATAEMAYYTKLSISTLSLPNSVAGGANVTFTRPSGSAAGGTWSVSGGGTVVVATSGNGTFSPIDAGCYTATYNDAVGGCDVTQRFLVYPPAQPAPTFNSCDNGSSVTINPPQGASDYPDFIVEYSFDNGVTWGTSNTATLAESCAGYRFKTRWVYVGTCSGASAGIPTASTSPSSALRVVDITAPTVIGPLATGQTNVNACYIDENTLAIGMPTFNVNNTIRNAFIDNCTPRASFVITTTDTTITGNSAGWTLTYTYKVVDACGNELTGQTITHTGSDLRTITVPNSCMSGGAITFTRPNGSPTSGSEYNWTVSGGGTIVNSGGNATFTPTTPGCYTATYSRAGYCDINKPFVVFPPTTTAPVFNAGCGSDVTIQIPANANDYPDFAIEYGTVNGATTTWGNSNTLTLTENCTGYRFRTRWSYTGTCGGVTNTPPNCATSTNSILRKVDVTAPIGTAPVGLTNINACYVDGSTITEGMPVFNPLTILPNYTDNCTGDLRAELISKTVTDNSCSWTLTYVYKVIDACGNELTGQTITHTGGDYSAPFILPKSDEYETFPSPGQSSVIGCTNTSTTLPSRVSNDGNVTLIARLDQSDPCILDLPTNPNILNDRPEFCYANAHMYPTEGEAVTGVEWPLTVSRRTMVIPTANDANCPNPAAGITLDFSTSSIKPTQMRFTIADIDNKYDKVKVMVYSANTLLPYSFNFAHPDSSFVGTMATSPATDAEFNGYYNGSEYNDAHVYSSTFPYAFDPSDEAFKKGAVRFQVLSPLPIDSIVVINTVNEDVRPEIKNNFVIGAMYWPKPTFDTLPSCYNSVSEAIADVSNNLTNYFNIDDICNSTFTTNITYVPSNDCNVPDSLHINIADQCTNASDTTVAFSVKPSVTLDTALIQNPICLSDEENNIDLPFTVDTGCVNKYAITYINGHGLSDVLPTALSENYITLAIPSTAESGNYTGTISFIDSLNGCTRNINFEFDLEPCCTPPILTTVPQSSCAPDAVDLTATGVVNNTNGDTTSVTYTYFTDAAATNVLNNPDAVTVSGTYYIVGSTGEDCNDTVSVEVTIHPPVTLSGNVVCDNDNENSIVTITGGQANTTYSIIAIQPAESTIPPSNTSGVFTLPESVTSITVSANTDDCIATVEVNIECGESVPVDFISFNGSCNKSGEITLQWEVANEMNVNRYDVERSEDGILFTNAFTLPAIDDNKDTKSYSTVDHNAYAKNYYRIRQIDNDGKHTMSKIINVNCADVLSEAKLYPNPANSAIKFELNVAKEDKLQYWITDALGRIVVDKIMTSVYQGNYTQSIDVSKLSDGIYMFHYLLSNSNNPQVLRFNKQSK